MTDRKPPKPPKPETGSVSRRGLIPGRSVETNVPRPPRANAFKESSPARRPDTGSVTKRTKSD
jgi:hypothetical protein